MKLVCALVNVSESEQLEWNSAYKSGIIPENTDNKKIVLPYQKAMQLAEWQDSVYTISNNAFNPEDFIQKTSVLTHHVVAKGQTLAQISNKYGVSASGIKKWNNLKSSKLKAGKNLRIFKTETIQLPVTTQHPLGLMYYITDNDAQTLTDICGKFAEFDLLKTCAMNAIDNPQAPIGKGKLIKLYLK
jgi:LysM repeat protein